MKKYLQKKIADAVAERQEPKGYGDNPEELETTTSGYIYVTPDELNQIVKSRKCRNITLSTNLSGHDEETLKNGTHYPYAFSVFISLPKKTVKKMISDFGNISLGKFIKVRVSRQIVRYCVDEGKHFHDGNFNIGLSR